MCVFGEENQSNPVLTPSSQKKPRPQIFSFLPGDIRGGHFDIPILGRVSQTALTQFAWRGVGSTGTGRVPLKSGYEKFGQQRETLIKETL